MFERHNFNELLNESCFFAASSNLNENFFKEKLSYR